MKLQSCRGKIGSPPAQASWHELVDVYDVDGTTKIGNATAWEVRREQLLVELNWIWMDLECWFQLVPALNHDEVLGRFTFVPSTIPGLNYPELNFFDRISEAKQRRGT